MNKISSYKEIREAVKIKKQELDRQDQSNLVNGLDKKARLKGFFRDRDLGCV